MGPAELVTDMDRNGWRQHPPSATRPSSRIEATVPEIPLIKPRCNICSGFCFAGALPQSVTERAWNRRRQGHRQLRRAPPARAGPGTQHAISHDTWTPQLRSPAHGLAGAALCLRTRLAARSHCLASCIPASPRRPPAALTGSVEAASPCQPQPRSSSGPLEDSQLSLPPELRPLVLNASFPG